MAEQRRNASVSREEIGGTAKSLAGSDMLLMESHLESGRRVLPPSSWAIPALTALVVLLALATALA
jgi:hypothetical protein